MTEADPSVVTGMWIMQNIKLIIFDRIQRNIDFHAILHRFHLCDYLPFLIGFKIQF